MFKHINHPFLPYIPISWYGGRFRSASRSSGKWPGLPGEDNHSGQSNPKPPSRTSLGGPDHWFKSGPPVEAILLPRSYWPKVDYQRRDWDKHPTTINYWQPHHPLRFSEYHGMCFGWSTILHQHFYKQKQRGELPQTLKGNDCNLMMEYEPCCPNNRFLPRANQWLTG